jgi:hypothetical protein
MLTCAYLGALETEKRAILVQPEQGAMVPDRGPTLKEIGFSEEDAAVNLDMFFRK